MSYFQEVLIWTKQAFLPLGTYGLFFLSVIESIFFPVPPEAIMIPLCLAHPKLSLWFGIVASVGSVVGGCIGYAIGYFGGKNIFLKLFRKHKFISIHKFYDTYGVWAIVIAGVTPIPYKIVTIGSGILYIKFWKFVVASLLSRMSRFMVSAVLLFFYGERILGFIQNYLNIIFYSITLLGALFLFFYFYKYRNRYLTKFKNFKERIKRNKRKKKENI